VKRPSVNDMCEAYVAILETIPEFGNTVSAVIEMQLAFNRSEMSRLDGIAYGFLCGRYPDMSISLNSATIRKKFIADRLTDEDEGIVIPSGYPAAKRPSMVFVCAKLPSFYRHVMRNEDKIDDICDSLVYASIAAESYRVKQGSARVARR
jgi:hypothetical protein